MAFVVCALLRSTRVGGVGAGAGVQSWNEVVLEKITTFMNVNYSMQKNFKRLGLQTQSKWCVRFIQLRPP